MLGNTHNCAKAAKESKLALTTPPSPTPQLRSQYYGLPSPNGYIGPYGWLRQGRSRFILVGTVLALPMRANEETVFGIWVVEGLLAGSL